MDIEIDVLAGDIGWFLGQVPSYPDFAVHPFSMTYLETSNQTHRKKT